VNIFRREVLESRRSSWIGEIQLVRPPSLVWLTAGVVLAVAALGTFVSVGEYTRKVRVAGVLMPDRGVVRLTAPQDAVLLEARVGEGAHVKAGEVLFVLSLDRTQAAGDTQAAVQQSLGERKRSLADSAAQQRQLLASRMDALARRQTDLQRDIASLDGEAAVLAQRVALAEAAQARYESLRRDAAQRQ